ncbi:hypothetical protein MRX96_034231 [Rhipicephalus microplus]
MPKFPKAKTPKPKSPDDASAVTNYIPIAMCQRRHLLLAATQKESELTQIMPSWCWEQQNSAERLSLNLDAFHGNYFVLLLLNLASNVTEDLTLLLDIVAVVMVCAALKLYERLVAVAYALPHLYFVDLRTRVTWFFRPATTIVFVDASQHAEPVAAA